VNSIFLFVATLSIVQCQDVYYGPPVSYGPPIVLAPTDYHNIHYSGTVYSKKYVAAVTSDGQKISVPVINGLLPTINSKRLASGGTQRDFWYDGGFKYRGEAVVSYIQNEKKKAVVPPVREEGLPLSKKAGIRGDSLDEDSARPPTKARDEELPPKRLQMPDPNIQQLQDSIGELQKNVVELREAVKNQVPASEPKKADFPSPMKKPSEFDKEPK